MRTEPLKIVYKNQGKVNVIRELVKISNDFYVFADDNSIPPFDIVSFENGVRRAVLPVKIRYKSPPINAKTITTPDEDNVGINEIMRSILYNAHKRNLPIDRYNGFCLESEIGVREFEKIKRPNGIESKVGLRHIREWTISLIDYELKNNLALDKVTL
jgi:hypothetical protein